MKGLIIQDYYLMKKNLIISSFVCIYFFVILLLGSTNSKNSEIDIVIYVLCGLIPCFMTSCSCFTINSDRNSKTSFFTKTLPINTNVIVKEKYIITYALLLLSYFVIAFFGVINHFICNYKPGKNVVFICFIVFSLILLFTNLELPLTMRFGQTVAAVMIIVLFFITIIVSLALLVKTQTSPDLVGKISYVFKHKTKVTFILLGINIVQSFVSYTIARYINK